MSDPGRSTAYKASEESNLEQYKRIRWQIGSQNWQPFVYDSLLTSAAIALVTAIIEIMHLYPRYPSTLLFYLLLIIALAGIRGSYAAFLAVLLSSFSSHYFLTTLPFPTSFPEQPADDLLDPWVFLAVGITAGQVTAVLRRSAERAKSREQAVLLLSKQAQELAILEERQRLARELHDSISQTLYGINLGVRSALEALDEDPGEAVAAMQYIVSLTEAGLAEMRVLIFELRPESLATDGIVVALNRQVAVLRSRDKLLVETALDEEPDLPPEDKYALYRIAQEALHNIVKHADASAVTLRLLKQESELILEVVDDGKGFDPIGPFPGHLGLRSIQERADQLGGVFIIESAPAQGTRLWIRILTRETLPLSVEQERGRRIVHSDRLHPSFE
jgi:signal transduction histidine kinase